MRDFQLPGRSPVIATNGMCATSHPLAAQVAVRILQSGGNAVDAAIAAAGILGIAEPAMTGLGGDCFVLLKPPGTEKVIALNGSGRAPAGLNAQDLRDRGLDEIPERSAAGVTVPGAVDAFCRLSQDWGRIGLADSLAPAIEYAENGIPVAQRTAFDWAFHEKTLLQRARDYFLIDGEPPTEGQVFRHPQQADVLRRIAANGREAFYEGEIAEDMVASLQAAGGSHTLQDFADTACDYTDPISGTYHGTELIEHPPNGQGAAAILLANILRNFDLTGMDPFGTKRTHIETEAAKLAYDARDRFVADPDHVARLDHMLALDTADQLAALIDPTRALETPNKRTAQVHRETVYLTVVDRDLMAVSMIYSIYHAFGSGICSDKFGILFHNRGTGFNLQTGHPNEAGGGKRPKHTIIPGMLARDGKVIMPFGVMGGNYQALGHVRFLSNMVDFGMSPQAAIDGPRTFPELGDLRLENGYDDFVARELSDLGHKVVRPPLPVGGAQAIMIDRENGTLSGASDPRKDGAAIGY